jgi:aspartate/methionine/tyrosine aminotransferase
VNLHPRDDGWHLDLDELEHAVNHRTRLLVANFPHNPTGYLPSRREFDSIVEIARKHGVYLLGDEMYRFLEHDPARRLPAVCDAYEKGISLSGLSKSFALAGLRTGWLATRETALIERWLMLKDYTTICHSAPGEVLGIIALQARREILERNRTIVLSNLKTAESFFSNHRDLFQWIEPGGGSVVFPRWNGPGTVEAFCGEALAETGVCIVPGSLFDFRGSHFRVGLGRRDMGEVLGIVGEFCTLQTQRSGGHQ